MSRGKIVAATVAGHFAAAFAALGLPPFYDRILHGFGNTLPWLAGACFVAPTVLAALSNPLWGKLADRYGKKRLLLRAHIGLALSFWLTGCAGGVGGFCLGLLAQGCFGGTFAASNAYLATQTPPGRLPALLTLMQGSARAALFTGPALMGLLTSEAGDPLLIYRWLTALPLAAAVFIAFLPSDAPAVAAGSAPEPVAEADDSGPGFAHVCAFQFALTFGIVVTFPYFVTSAKTLYPDFPDASLGLLFGLPHLAYLLAAVPLTRAFRRCDAGVAFAVSLGAFGVTMAAFAYDASPARAVFWRCAAGVAMTAAYVSVHAMAAGRTGVANAGRRFGALEASAKWGTVFAGAVAGAAVVRCGPRAPFLISCCACALSAIHAATLVARRRSPIRGEAGDSETIVPEESLAPTL